MVDNNSAAALVKQHQVETKDQKPETCADIIKASSIRIVLSVLHCVCVFLINYDATLQKKINIYDNIQVLLKTFLSIKYFRKTESI